MANEVAYMFREAHKRRQMEWDDDKYIKEVAPAMLNVDTQSTALSPQYAGVGSYTVDRMDAMAKRQGLHDNSLMFIPAAGTAAKGGKKVVDKMLTKEAPKSPYKTLSDLMKAAPEHDDKLLPAEFAKKVWMETEARKYGKSVAKHIGLELYEPNKKVRAVNNVINAFNATVANPKVSAAVVGGSSLAKLFDED